MNIVEFWTICSTNGIILDEPERKRIERFSGELLHWNKKVNLVSRKDEENIYIRHILHSLSSLKYVDVKPSYKCLDVGTGGGLPGIPLAIMVPGAKFTLVDSIAKKVKVTEMLAKHTGLQNIRVIDSRIEELASKAEHKQKYDVIFARAVTKLERLLGWSKDLLKQGGKYVVYKGGNLDDEISEAKEIYKVNVEEIQIKLFGIDWFEKENKKLLICSF